MKTELWLSQYTAAGHSIHTCKCRLLAPTCVGILRNAWPNRAMVPSHSWLAGVTGSCTQPMSTPLPADHQYCEEWGSEQT